MNISIGSSVSSMLGDFIKRTLLGESVETCFNQIGNLSKKGAPIPDTAQITAAALNDSSAFIKTCVKVTFLTNIFATFIPFFFGGITASIAFTSLVFAVITVDISEILHRYKELQIGEVEGFQQSFTECNTTAARIEFMLYNTMFLRQVPTDWLIKTGEVFGFIPVDPVEHASGFANQFD